MGVTCSDIGVMPLTDVQRRAAAAATLCLLNLERGAHGLVKVIPNRRLTTAAQSMSDAMVAEHFFDHTTPLGTTLVSRLRAIGYIPRDLNWAVGGNIGWGTRKLATPARMMQAWMQSPEHRRNILDPRFRQIGIGITTGVPMVPDEGQAGATYATDFGATWR